MELVRERQTAELTNVEAQRHNAQIRERYRLLQSAEADQFAQEQYSAPVQEQVVIDSTPSFTPSIIGETPVMEQVPFVKDFVRERLVTDVFTSEKFEQTTIDPGVVTVVEPVVVPVMEQTPVATTSESTEVAAHYSLSTFAKVIMAIFAAVVIALLSLIAYNSQVLNQKRIHIKNLEQKREQLLEQQEELQARIALAESEESILQWAQSQGMVQLSN